MRITTLALSTTLGLSALACSAGDSADLGPATRGSVGVGVGGAQDIARFRSIVDRGEVPDVETLDPIGFFAEHAMDLPAADCGSSVCAHPMLAVAPRFDGDNWTTAFIGLNSAVDPSTLARPAVHVAVVLDSSAGTLERRADIVEGLRHFLAGLRDEDRISVVRAGARAEVLIEGAAPASPALAEAVLSLDDEAVGGVALYDGIATAADLVAEGELRHVLVIGAGAATAGITDEDRILSLVENLGIEGTSLSYVGVDGGSYEDRLPLAIADLGTGTYYFAQDRDDLIEVLSLEGRTALFPVARDFELVVTAAPGYRIGRITGAPRAVVTETTATIEAPVLLLGQREGALDVDRGRRGGGGGIFVELLAEDGTGIPAGSEAFSISVRYLDQIAGAPVTLSGAVNNALPPGVSPSLADLPNFSDDRRAKVFMMLNMYFGLRAAVNLYQDGDCARSLGAIDMMSDTVEIWQGSVYADPDIRADWELMLDLRDNVQLACETSGPVEPTPPRSFEGGCFGD
jgi:Ca-activated chloride channel family protein